MLPSIELYNALNKAQQKNLFNELEKTYQTLPETSCKSCAQCCNWGSPPGFFIEYLYMYKYVRDNLKHRWSNYLTKSAEYYYLELVDANQKCPFVGEDNRCEIYPVRPLTCRFYGLLNKDDFEMGDLNQGLKFIAEKLWADNQIKVPDEIANHTIPWCGNVENSTGKHLKKDVLAGLISDVAKLDTSFFSDKLIDQEGTMFPYPVHLMNTVMGDGARARKIKIMKEFSDNQTKEIMTPFVNKAAKFEF